MTRNKQSTRRFGAARPTTRLVKVSSIISCPLPPDALLQDYLRGDAYTDCYATDIPQCVSQTQYVEAFYTTAIFRIERLLLKWLASKPSTDAQVRQLAAAAVDAFAAWQVESRSANQLLLRDYTGRTRSWLMVMPNDDAAASTRLYFGSAVVPVRRTPADPAELGIGFRALLGFHKLYSRVLLAAARRRLCKFVR
ncbi:MAG: hypothetical protein ABI843_06115 [Dokdonella sp.]